MGSTVYFLFLIAAVVVQVLGAPGKITSEDDAKQQFTKLKEYARKEVDAGRKQLHDLTDQVGQELNKLTQEHLLQISSEVQTLTSRLAKVKNDAKTQGKDISDCLEDSEDFFRQITEKNTYESVIQSIIFKKILLIANHIRDSLTKITHIFDFNKEIKGELDKCKVSKEEKCFDAVVVHINKVKAKIPKDIKEQVDLAKQKGAPILSEAIQQVKDYSWQLRTEAKNTVDEIEQCGNDKKTS